MSTTTPRPRGRRRLPAAVAFALMLSAALAPTTPAQDAGRAQRRDAVVRAVERVGPAVVNISTETVRRNPFGDAPDLFEWFFGGGGGGRGRGGGRVENSLGSGVIVDPSGYVLTNDHVVAAASKITVTLSDQRQVEADLVGSDRASDLAVLRLKGSGPYPAVELGSSDDLMIGETVIAIGNPFGLQNTVTTGVVSAVGRTLAGPDDTPFADFVQTDAAINPGNSGGALINILGQLIGINSQIVARGQNLGFAIPIDRARKIYRELVEYGKVRQAWTGLVLEDLEADEAKELGIGDSKGVFVRKRFSDSPAEQAGINSGDLIVGVGGQRVATVPEFDTALARAAIGGSVAVRLRRDGRELVRELPVRLFPREKAAAFAWSLLGLEVGPGRNGGVMITRVREDSAAAEIGLTGGLGLTELNGRSIDSVEAFLEALPEASYRRAANLVVRARDGFYRVTVPLEPGSARRAPRSRTR